MDDAFIRTAFERCPAGLLIVDAEGRIVVTNDEVERLFGYPRAVLLGQSIELLVPERVAAGHVAQRKAFAGTPSAHRMGGGREVVARHRQGHELFIEVGLSAITTAEGTFILATVVDVTARRRLEERLREADKLAAVGALASGIAHDFNNILQGIIGYSELVRAAVADNTAVAEDLDVVIDTARRGRELVHRILTESGGKGKGPEMDASPDVSREHSSAIQSTNRANRRRVLLVEDEPHLARLGERILERANFDVTSYTSSPRALDAFRVSPDQFDLLITDNSMPSMTGLELVAHIHRIRADLPVIMVSGLGDAMSIEELRRRGVRRLLSKPYLAADFCAAAFELVHPASSAPPREG